MQTKGFVLVLCLLFGLLISALALAALMLSELSSRFNQAGLQQKRQAMQVMELFVAQIMDSFHNKSTK